MDDTEKPEQTPISIKEASTRLKVSHAALYKEFGRDLTCPAITESGAKYLLWPQVRDEWNKHRRKPRSIRSPKKMDLVGSANPQQENQGDAESNPSAAQPPHHKKYNPVGYTPRSVEILAEPTPYTKVRTAATALKIQHQKEKFESEKRKEPFAIRAERAKAEREETNAASALIELHLKAKTLMPVDELEDRLRERDMVIRDRFLALPVWLREQHPNIGPDVIVSIERFCEDTLQRLGKGILTADERDSAEEMTNILSDRRETEED